LSLPGFSATLTAPMQRLPMKPVFLLTVIACAHMA
jgi:hypothetical protein